MGTSESVEREMLKRHDIRRSHVGWGIVKNQVDIEPDNEGHVARPE